jgi:Undecaprenyl-phosphate glucose phosphotransferase
MKVRLLSRDLIADALRLFDVLMVLGGSGLAFYIYVDLALHADYLLDGYVNISLIAAVAYVALGRLLEVYQPFKLPDAFYGIGRSLTGFGFTLIGCLALGFATHTTDDWSRGWAILWVALTVSGLVLGRLMLSWAIIGWRRDGHWNDRIVVVGLPELASRVINDLTEKGVHADTLAVFDERAEPRRGTFQTPRPLLFGLQALFEFVRFNPVDQIIIAIPWSNEARILTLVDRLSVLPVDITLAFDTQVLHKRALRMRSSRGLHLMQMGSRPLTERQILAKRIEDLVLGSLITLAVSPILLLVALLIRLESPGPIFFRQKRHGFNDTVFEILKFRTMYVDQGDASGLERTVRGDPRVTPIGRFLRRWSVDELPQLLNVLKGDMSLIGPRPHPVGMLAEKDDYREVVQNYAARHRVKPGITGWAQVNGYRGAAETKEVARLRVEHDLEYIDRWSLLFDFRILVMTAFSVAAGTEAY